MQFAIVTFDVSVERITSKQLKNRVRKGEREREREKEKQTDRDRK